MSAHLPDSRGLLVLPRLRIQNANAISSPLTHGFPSMTAFLGVMWALQRSLDTEGLPILLECVGVVCHAYQELVTEGGFTRRFRLTRNPVQRDGSTAAIVEEGRIHLEISLVFGIEGGAVEAEADDESRDRLASTVLQILSGMRIAGGSVLPSLGHAWRQRPHIVVWAEGFEDRLKQFRRVRRQLLPGFALVARDDLLRRRTESMQASDPSATSLDALLDLSRINWRCQRHEPEAGQSARPRIEWTHDRTEGWIVPIPVGYAALTPQQAAGTVRNARDPNTPFVFVESLYSVGQWIAPHRLSDASAMLWYAESNPEAGYYRCRNDYTSSIPQTVD